MDTLQLMARGRTNGEIAEELGLTLAGAKWNVSEVLTKLGFETREEAGDFYRWYAGRNSRARRVFRAFTGLGLWKAAGTAGAVAVVAVLGIGATVQAFGDGEPEQPGLPFSAEVRVTRVDPNLTTEATGRWWYGDATHGRTETDTPEVTGTRNGHAADSGAKGTSTTVFDGMYRWAGGGGSIYQKDEIRVTPGGVPPSQWESGPGTLGPLPDATLEDFVARQTIDAPVTLDGHAAVGGRGTVIVTRRPVGTTMFARYWVDPRRMFVMRSQIDSGDGELRLTAEVTRLDYGEPQDPSRFSWVAPVGAAENACRPVVAEAMAGRFPAGFLAVPVSTAPESLVLASSGMATAKDGSCGEVHVDLRPVQRPGAIPQGEAFLQVGENRERPDSVITGSRDDVRELADGMVEAYLWHEPGVTLLAWVHDGLGVQLKANTLSEDELVAFGEAMLAGTTAATP